MTETTEFRDPIVRRTAPRRAGPDLMSMPRLNKLLGIDDAFAQEFSILAPHLRKLTQKWSSDIPLKIVQDESIQDTMTIRDLNRINALVGQIVQAMNDGKFGDEFEGPLDGIALILKTHGINPGWATTAFASSFDEAHHKLYFETRQANARVYPAALRCLTKITTLVVHILNRRDHELNDGHTRLISKTVSSLVLHVIKFRKQVFRRCSCAARRARPRSLQFRKWAESRRCRT